MQLVSFGKATMPPSKEITQMLVDWRNGHLEALEQLLPIIYDELRRLARHELRRERPDHTLQATALVHKAYLRLVDQKDLRWQHRAHFFGIAAHLMRQILVQHARDHQRTKRSKVEHKLPLDEALGLLKGRDVEPVALNDALTSLATRDPQKSRIIELRIFAGLTMEEIAEVLGVPLRTIEREWRTARAWIQRELLGGP